MTQELLKKATEEVDNPDLRDRAYIYWRMLSHAPDMAAEVVLENRPTIDTEEAAAYSPELLEELLA